MHYTQQGISVIINRQQEISVILNKHTYICILLQKPQFCNVYYFVEVCIYVCRGCVITDL